MKNDNSEEECWEDATGNQDDSLAGDENSLSAGADTKSRISFRSSGQRLSNLRQKQSLSVENGNSNEQGLLD